jgi:hypothetical protein
MATSNPGGLAPAPQFPERISAVYEEKIAPAIPGNRGPLRFEEGIGSDTDVPNDFTKGVLQGYITAPGQPNHNANVYEKWPEETMAERAHVGSAAWVEAPSFLSEFAHGAFSASAEQHYEQVDRSGGRYERIAPSVVVD